MRARLMKPHLMKTNIATELVKGLPLEISDAARLVVECVEELGEQFNSRDLLLRRLRRVLREGVRAVQLSEHTQSFETTAWASVEARAARRPTTRRDLRSFVRRMLRVNGVADMPLRAMTTRDCRELLQAAFGKSQSSYKKGRAILHSIFAFGMRREWCDTNPVDRIEVPLVQEQHIPPLSLEEIKRLEHTARRPEHAAMRSSLSLMLYCGLRPNEVKRLRPEDIRLAEREIIIRPAVSKTGGGRVVPLRHPLPGRLSIPPNWEARWRSLRRAAGFTHWKADSCRHSFASYHAAWFRDIHSLQYEMGHCNAELLRTRYVSPVARRAAQKFWRDIPPLQPAEPGD